MSASVLDHAPELLKGGGSPPPGGGDAGGPRGGGPPEASFDTAKVGMLAFMGTVTMLFLGFSSALLLRRASVDWQPLRAPSLLWLSSGALVASSLALQVARRRLRGWDLLACERWVAFTGVLGAAFVTAQFAAWQELAAQGVFLATNPSSSFFYVLTGTHVVHVAAGLAWFATIAFRLRRMALLPGHDGLSLFAMYWHFLGGLWIYLLLLMFAF